MEGRRRLQRLRLSTKESSEGERSGPPPSLRTYCEQMMMTMAAAVATTMDGKVHLSRSSGFPPVDWESKKVVCNLAFGIVARVFKSCQASCDTIYFIILPLIPLLLVLPFQVLQLRTTATSPFHSKRARLGRSGSRGTIAGPTRDACPKGISAEEPFLGEGSRRD